MQTMQTITKIKFTPCTGFGDIGRAATLLDASGECIGTGYGGTDNEAVVEALMDAGMTFDQAFDAYGDTMTGARIYHEECQPNN